MLVIETLMGVLQLCGAWINQKLMVHGGYV